MSMETYLLLVVGMGLATYLPRLLPLVCLADRRLPRWLTEWLDLVPAAILGALIAPSLFTAGTPRTLVLGSPELLAAVPTFAVALRSRSLGWTVVTGMALYWLVRSLLS
jgi:branched-subunit amino acid transport protein